jgi:hypothetical protein
LTATLPTPDQLLIQRARASKWKDFEDWSSIPPHHISEPLCLAFLADNPYRFNNIPPQYHTPALCLLAVSKRGRDLEHVAAKHQTPQLIEIALNQNPSSVRFILEPNVNHWFLAIQIAKAQQKQQFLPLSHLDTAYSKLTKDDVEKIKLHLIEIDSSFIYRLKKQSRSICMRAIELNPLLLRFCKHRTKEICLKAVEGDWRALFYCPRPTLDMINAALSGNPDLTPANIDRYLKRPVKEFEDIKLFL